MNIKESNHPTVASLPSESDGQRVPWLIQLAPIVILAIAALGDFSMVGIIIWKSIKFLDNLLIRAVLAVFFALGLGGCYAISLWFSKQDREALKVSLIVCAGNAALLLVAFYVATLE